MSAWTYASTTDAPALAARLAAASNVILTTHTKPDGDAIGSCLALARALRSLGARVQLWLAGPVDFSLQSFLAGEAVGDPVRGLPADPVDLCVLLDTGAWSQVEAMAPWLRANRERVVGIDHHRRGDDIAPMRLVQPRCASTTQVLVPVMDALGVPLTAPAPGRDSIAEALYIGLATDTGWFRFESAGPEVYRLVARLLDAGVDKDQLYRRIEETARPGRLRLLARALASLELLCGDRAALMTLTEPDFAASGGAPEDLSGVVNAPMVVGSVEVSVLLSQSEPGVVKASFRSKPAWAPGGAFVDVNALAAEWGGGGHVHAAGARFRQPLAEVQALVREALSRRFGAAPSSTPA